MFCIRLSSRKVDIWLYSKIVKNLDCPMQDHLGVQAITCHRNDGMDCRSLIGLSMSSLSDVLERPNQHAGKMYDHVKRQAITLRGKIVWSMFDFGI